MREDMTLNEVCYHVGLHAGGHHFASALRAYAVRYFRSAHKQPQSRKTTETATGRLSGPRLLFTMSQELSRSRPQSEGRTHKRHFVTADKFVTAGKG